MASEADQGRSAVFVREATGLTRQLSAKDVFMTNILNMGIPWTVLVRKLPSKLSVRTDGKYIDNEARELHL